jgi:glycosyltransferase involved in cell wall biosynthesis
MTFNLSVIICTHNPRHDYLRPVLDGLGRQTLPLNQWELLLVDNASKENLAERFDLSWHPHAHQIREHELGLTPARLRGIGEECFEKSVELRNESNRKKNRTNHFSRRRMMLNSQLRFPMSIGEGAKCNAERRG